MKNEVAIRILKKERSALHDEYERLRTETVDMQSVISENTRRVDSIRVQLNAIESALHYLEKQNNFGRARR